MIKLSLNEVLRRDCSAIFRRRMYERCKLATRFSVLASLLLLFKVNTAVDSDDTEFFDRNAADVIHDCYYGVNQDNSNNESHMPPEFRSVAAQFGNVLWPHRAGMVNSFRYLFRPDNEKIQDYRHNTSKCHN